MPRQSTATGSFVSLSRQDVLPCTTRVCVGDEGSLVEISGCRCTRGASNGYLSFRVRGANNGFLSSRVHGASNGYLRSRVYGASNGYLRSRVYGANNGFLRSRVSGASNGYLRSRVYGASNGYLRSRVYGASNGFLCSRVYGASNGFLRSMVYGASNGFLRSRVYGANNLFLSSRVQSLFTVGRVTNSTVGKLNGTTCVLRQHQVQTTFLHHSCVICVILVRYVNNAMARLCVCVNGYFNQIVGFSFFYLNGYLSLSCHCSRRHLGPAPMGLFSVGRFRTCRFDIVKGTTSLFRQYQSQRSPSLYHFHVLYCH
ncbi:hypothetical protein ACOMHN_014255 [Nucella lapillus]